MYKIIGSLLIALVLTGALGVVRPAEAQRSRWERERWAERRGARRFSDGRWYGYGGRRWEGRPFRQWERERWRERRGWERR
jgi:hypothetical protein